MKFNDYYRLDWHDIISLGAIVLLMITIFALSQLTESDKDATMIVGETECVATDK